MICFFLQIYLVLPSFLLNCSQTIYRLRNYIQVEKLHNWASFQKDEQSLFCGPIQKLGLVWVTVFVSVCFQALRGWMLQQDNWGSVGQFPTPQSPWKGLSTALEPMFTDCEYKVCTSTPTQHTGSSWPLINYVISHSIGPSTDLALNPSSDTQWPELVLFFLPKTFSACGLFLKILKRLWKIAHANIVKNKRERRQY